MGIEPVAEEEIDTGIDGFMNSRFAGAIGGREAKPEHFLAARSESGMEEIAWHDYNYADYALGVKNDL